MPKTEKEIKNVAVAVHPKNDQAYLLAQEISAYLESLGLAVLFGRMDDETLRKGMLGGSQDLLIALGGDGTMLRAGHISADHRVPILGINMGSYGFLTGVKRGDWKDALERILIGDYWLEDRMMLDSTLIRDKQELGRWNALNDVVISRGQEIRPIQLKIHINHRHLSTIVADAIIASTATGSTAYAMAAGGPILSPELRNIILVPVAPHLSIEQTLVLSESVLVAVEVFTSHQAVICVDGQTPIQLQTGDWVEIRASQDYVNFIRFEDPGYFYRNLIPYMDQNPSIKKKTDV